MTRTRRDDILDRLRPHGLTGEYPLCGFYHPDDHAIIRTLEAEGKVTSRAGEGKDRGLLLVRLKSPAALAADTTRGGAA
jgi:hypothetical protein